MVKPPRIRHSKARRDPVTIEHESVKAATERDGDAADTARPGSAPDAPPAETSTKTPAGTRSDTAASGTESGSPDTGPKPDAEKASVGDRPAPRPETPSRDGGDRPVFGRDAAGPAMAKPAAGSVPPTATGGASQGKASTGDGGDRRGGLSLVAAGLVGAVVALAGGAGLQYAGLLPSPGSGDGAAGLQSQIDALKADLTAAASDAGGDALEAANQRIAQLTATAEELRGEIETLKSAVSSGGAGDAAAVEALDARLKEVETTVAGLGEGAAAPSGQVEALEARLASAETAAKAAGEAASAASSAAAGASERLGALEADLKALSERVDQQASNPKIALAIAAAGLKSAIDRGVPFMTELETYAAVAPDAPEIAELRDLAASGVPTRARIAAEAGAAAQRMVAAAEPVASDAGVFDRLLASFQSLVKVRPIGAVEGDGPGATVARMEVAIEADDYERAIAEYESLPDPARAAGADFIAMVKARQSADALVEKALSGAIRD